ncbi:MAG: cytochrome c [Nitrosomonas sp.]|uniref:c-type cytochrome n=1 Tax=Nitrosomonas sp. TaxID=42353 RepID=UPI0025DE23C8|nr:cytochrome c [Nitrosomonas sp.]MBY0473605.1 cytochrome c [Nitrosomonas sp.]
MKRTHILVVVSALFILVGCGGTANDYSPPADASGERIFSTVCSECHKPLSANKAMILSEKSANKEAIIKKFQSGSMRMPAFKNIQGEAADRLAEYILTNSEVQQ